MLQIDFGVGQCEKPRMMSLRKPLMSPNDRTTLAHFGSLALLLLLCLIFFFPLS